MAQQIFSTCAVYFVIWWITLFAVLPFGVRTQAEDNEVILGTVESAPTSFRAWRVVVITSLVSGVIYCGWYLSWRYLGFSFDSLPQIVPRHDG
jgi:predicted secreted protein